MAKAKRYNYRSLAREMIQMFNNPNAHRRGIASWKIMDTLDIGSFPTFRLVKKAANDLLRENGQIVQYDPSWGSYFLVTNGGAEKGLLIHKRYLISRLTTYRNDTVAARNGYIQGTTEWKSYNSAARNIRRAIEDLADLPDA